MGRYLFFLLILVIVSAGVTYAVLLANNPAPEVGEKGTIPETKQNPLSNIQKNETQLDLQQKGNLAHLPEMPEMNQPNFEQMRAKWNEKEQVNQLELERTYTYCGHTIKEQLKPDSPMLSLPRTQLLKIYSGWKVKEEVGSRLLLHRRIEDFCPEDLNKRYVGKQNGYVTIFYGEPGMKEKVFKVTDISTENLPLQLKAKLEKGIESESEDHLISIIEGLTVYYNE